MNAMNWTAIYPEILLLVMACVITLVDLWVRDPMRRPTFWLTQASLVAVAAMHLAYYQGPLAEEALIGKVGAIGKWNLAHLLFVVGQIGLQPGRIVFEGKELIVGRLGSLDAIADGEPLGVDQ